MALFKSKEEKEAEAAAQDEQKQLLYRAFDQSEFMNSLIENIFSEENAWIYTQYNYYDDRRRVVKIENDCVCIKHEKYNHELVESSNKIKNNLGIMDDHVSSEILNSVAYSFTQSGWLPLDTIKTSFNAKEIFAEVLWYKMWNKMHTREEGLESYYSYSDGFSYYVPKGTWQSWI